MRSLKILRLGGSLPESEIVRESLTEAGFDPAMDCTVTKSEFVSLLRGGRYDVILSDFQLPGFDAFGALELSAGIAPDIPFICVSRPVGEETAVELMKHGAADYVTTGHLASLPSAVQRALDGAARDKSRRPTEDSLRESEERYRTLVTCSPDAIYVHVDGRITLVNPALCKLLGTNDPSNLVGMTVFEIVHPAYHEQVRARWELVSRGLPAPLLEEKFIRLDGTAVDVEAKAVAIDWQGAKGVQVIARDITPRKRVEEVVRDSEERFRMVFEHVFDGISIYDEDPDPARRRLVECNDRYAAMAGRSREELLRIGSTKGLQKTLEETANSARIESLGRGTEYMGSFSWIRPDGKENVIEYVGVPITWRGKSYSIGIDRDVTGRKLAEDHLRQSEEQFRLIAENGADMIAVLDLDSRRIYASPGYSGIPVDPEALTGTDGFREVHPDDVNRVRDAFQKTVRTGIGTRFEYRFLLKDGSVRTIDSKGSVIRDGDGRITRVILVSRDVTEEKRLAANFLRSQRMESIGTLAGGIAHDLNNVLAPIMMAIEILRSKISDPGGRKVLATIETSAKRGADIVRQVLAFGRGVEGERIFVQLRHVVGEVIKIAGETFPRSIEIRKDIPRGLWTVSADPTQMHQVLLNILVNARDAMPGGGTLTIGAENITLDEKYSLIHPEAKPGPYVSVVINDTGTGVPAEIREKIFEPFFTTKEIGMGTGLGLSTTLAIVRSHGGFITLESEMGKGTTFRIYIPATGATSGGAAADEEPELPAGNGELILVIDDEAAIREITRETLLAYGYAAVTAGDGAEGVALFARNRENIKVVITDIMMPVMDGTAAILALKKIRPDVKIIAASGLAAGGRAKARADSNVQAFLTKPYTAEALLTAVRAALHGLPAGDRAPI